MDKRKTILAAVAITGLLSLTGCSSMTEEWNDAPVNRKLDNPAVIGSMPDGFANFGEKCDDSGHLIITTRGSAEGSGKDVAVILDPRACPKAGAPVKLADQ